MPYDAAIHNYTASHKAVYCVIKYVIIARLYTQWHLTAILIKKTNVVLLNKPRFCTTVGYTKCGRRAINEQLYSPQIGRST